MRCMLPWLLLSIAACTSPRTQIMVTTDTDLAIPSEIDAITIEVMGPEGDTRAAEVDVGALPAYLALYHESGPLSPVTVRVVGKLGGADVIERRALVAFQSERTVVLSMNLLAACATTPCADGETCAEGGCRSEMVDPGELADWTGTPPALGDAGVPTDTGPADTGDGDGGLDLTRDPLNCGSVDNACASTQVCVSSTCACRPGFTADGSGGCVNLQTDAMNCGSVGNVCGNVCRGGSCASSCGPETQCDSSCTRTRNDILNCGACGTVCATNQVCVNSMCQTFTIGVGCTSCPCGTCGGSLTCCEYPGFGDVVCVDGACP